MNQSQIDLIAKSVGAKINLSKIDERTPFNQKVGYGFETDWIGWGMSRDNEKFDYNGQYPDRIIDAVSESVVLGCAIRGLCDLAISGFIKDGFKVEGADARTLQILSKFDEKTIKKMIWNAAVFNACALFVDQILIEKNGQIDEILNTIRHVGIVELRANNVFKSQNSQVGDYDVCGWYHSPGWSALNIYGFPIRGGLHSDLARPVYVPQLSNGVECGIVYEMDYTIGDCFYPTSRIENVVNHARYESAFATFHLANIEGGNSERLIISILVPPGTIPDDEKDALTFRNNLTNQVKQQINGSAKVGDPIVLINEGAITEGASDPLRITSTPQNNNDNKHLPVSTIIEQKQLMAVGIIVPECVGIASPAGFSSKADTLAMGYELLKYMRIIPIQNIVLGAIKQVLKHYGAQFKSIGLGIYLPTDKLLDDSQKNITADSSTSNS